MGQQPESRPGLVVAGLMVADVVVKPFTGLPEEGDVVEMESIELHSGGDALNTALTLAALGHRPALVGCVGEDAFGRFLIEELQAYGVDVSYVYRHPQAPTAACTVLVAPDGQRHFLYQPGANRRLTADLIAPALSSSGGGYAGLHVGSLLALPALEEGLPALFARVRQEGGWTSFDVTWDRRGRWLEAIRPLLPHTSVFLPSEMEARQLTGREDPWEMARFLKDQGPEVVVLKLGERGCLWWDDHGGGLVPAKPGPVVDTTGAGDSFVAGFLSGRLEGLAVEACCHRAVAVAALGVGGLGADAAARRLREIGGLRIAEADSADGGPKGTVAFRRGAPPCPNG
jgi:sugar/nucleoside kinase (ribokinase family)